MKSLIIRGKNRGLGRKGRKERKVGRAQAAGGRAAEVPVGCWGTWLPKGQRDG